jgi:hypothetical protein
MPLTVDALKHEYWEEGVQLTSITDALKISGIIERVYGTDYDLWVGTATHRAIELWVRGLLKLDTLDPQLVPRLEAWIDFEKSTGFRAKQSELSMSNFPLRIAGTLDLLGDFPDGSEGIVEIKSGNVSAWTAIQTAGQDFLLGGGKRRKRFGLKVPAEGRPNVRPFTNSNDYAVFMAAVTIANWRREN